MQTSDAAQLPPRPGHDWQVLDDGAQNQPSPHSVWGAAASVQAPFSPTSAVQVDCTHAYPRAHSLPVHAPLFFVAVHTPPPGVSQKRPAWQSPSAPQTAPAAAGVTQVLPEPHASPGPHWPAAAAPHGWPFAIDATHLPGHELPLVSQVPPLQSSSV
jgi:hypothetical protein